MDTAVNSPRQRLRSSANGVCSWPVKAMQFGKFLRTGLMTLPSFQPFESAVVPPIGTCWKKKNGLSPLNSAPCFSIHAGKSRVLRYSTETKS